MHSQLAVELELEKEASREERRLKALSEPLVGVHVQFWLRPLYRSDEGWVVQRAWSLEV